MSRLFDPMGLVGAAIVSAKILLQLMWSKNFDWNQEVPKEFQDWWIQYRSEIQTLAVLKIPRRVMVDNPRVLEFHVFSDASDKAYGCYVYLKSINSMGERKCNLLISKSRVSPLSKQSTPRLELCAAVLAAQLAEFVLDATKINCPVTYWTDSTIVLHWLASSSSSCKVFVSNRIAEIHRLTRDSIWCHVPTTDNPADRVSRGILPSRLIDDDLWWHGPPFLLEDESSWPPNNIALSPLHLQARETEARQIVSMITTITTSLLSELIERHSLLSPLLRKVAWIHRFSHNARAREARNHHRGPLTATEIDIALKTLIKVAQKEYFSLEIDFLRKHQGPARKEMTFKSPLKKLNPFLDSEGLLRIFGRLQNLDAPFDTKYPIILPSKAHLTFLIAKATHFRMLHSGPQLLLATLRHRFWPIRGRDLATKIVRECMVCFRCKPKSICQIMGPLPAVRLTPSRPFVSSGVDYCGPFSVRPPNRRGSSMKIFVAIFICMWSKAVYIDMVYSLTTTAFVNVLIRFLSRHGSVAHIYCDNARTFVGANRVLQEYRREFNAMHCSEKLASHCADNGITFHFNPARSPHFGGLWEASVKTFKYHLYRIMKDSLLIIDDFHTLITQIQGVMNSRPLMPLSSDPADVIALTPALFLVGEPINSLPQPDLCDFPDNRLNSFQAMQKRFQHFWKAWSRDYIGQLQNRQKWPVVHPDVDVGTLVLLKKESTPPMKWNLGRVEQIFPGKDGHVRVVQVRTAQGTYRRAITEVCPLPIEQPRTQDISATVPADAPPTTH
ncbi:uncharacterized protein LOC129773480 [Toxorhynchites rutilus septentrionalis]|uniref:uncharacterized protein LOC129773480 n=1 Tax=Toxorhynchites rutilus septentrionalis TaxID=329112 RepID=UPI002479EDFF|nr:uncharacterized protein LOC129773480 [Toxorhynchites rutilus septentrionalis]